MTLKTQDLIWSILSDSDKEMYRKRYEKHRYISEQPRKIPFDSDPMRSLSIANELLEIFGQHNLKPTMS